MYAYLIPKYFYELDICKISDDKNPGAANVFKYVGKKVGILVVTLEVVKGFLPVFPGRNPFAHSYISFPITGFFHIRPDISFNIRKIH